MDIVGSAMSEIVPHPLREVYRHGEISAGVRNLFDKEHFEFVSEDYIVSSYVPRDAYVKLMWRF